MDFCPIYVTIIEKGGTRHLIEVPQHKTCTLADLIGMTDPAYACQCHKRGKPQCRVIAMGRKKLPPVTQKEESILERIYGFDPSIRIACCITVDKSLNGLIITRC